MRWRDWLPHPSDLILGRRLPYLPWPQVRLSRKAQRYHATIWGQTGSGKSKLIQSLFLQHVAKGRGCCILEPHHDLSFDTLATLIQRGFFRDAAAFDRLVYIDWGNGAFVPFNILAAQLPSEIVAANALEAFMRVWPELKAAPTFQTLFLSSVETLIANNLPITFLYQLLSDTPFRRHCLQQVTDPLIHLAFQSFERIRDQVAEAGSTLRRAFLISYHAAARLTLGQPDNGLDFRQLMDRGAAVIINLGNIHDHETKRLIGALLLRQIEQAALSRTDLLPQERRPFTVFVDEWQLFAAQEETIATILSQTRKFALSMYLASQSVAAIGSERLAGALENCKLNIVFGLGYDSAAHQSRHIGSIDPFAEKERAPSATQHALYTQIPEQFALWTKAIQNLDPQMAYVKLLNHAAIKMKTVHVPEVTVPATQVAAVVAEYKRRYQRTRAAVTERLAAFSWVPQPGGVRDVLAQPWLQRGTN